MQFWGPEKTKKQRKELYLFNSTMNELNKEVLDLSCDMTPIIYIFISISMNHRISSYLR